jgi:hypothetical protein
MRTVCFSEALVPTHPTRRLTPEGSNLNVRCLKNLEPHLKFVTMAYQHNYCVSGHYPLSCFYSKHTAFRRLDSASVLRWNLLSPEIGTRSLDWAQLRRFITVFTRAVQWSLSWARSIQSIPPHPLSLRFILILSTHLHQGLPSGLFPSGSPTNILHAFLFQYIYLVCHSMY